MNYKKNTFKKGFVSLLPSVILAIVLSVVAFCFSFSFGSCMKVMFISLFTWLFAQPLWVDYINFCSAEKADVEV